MTDEKDYFMPIPPGIPLSIIARVADRYGLKIVEKPLPFPQEEGDVPYALFFKGPREKLEEARKQLLEETRKWVEYLEKGRL